LYPFTENYVTPIKEFIARLNTYEGLDIVTNATSTQIVGEHVYVFEILSKETQITFSSGYNVFVMKILGFERDINHQKKKSIEDQDLLIKNT
jgi:uncharacterized protein YqgV (UPF0045/DUF77 family)